MSGHIKTILTEVSRWGGKRHPKIFISYRRHGEGAGYGGRIADRLVEHFGAVQCFRDVADIESGVDFVKTIREAVGACEVLVAVIGPDWISQVNRGGRRRLDDPRDFVRLEVAAALQRDIRVIPMLVGGAAMPTEQQLPDPLQGLSRRQAHELSDTRWEYDVARLLGTIESIGIKRHSPSKRTLGGKWQAAGISAAVLVLTSILISWMPTFSQGSQDQPASEPVQQQMQVIEPPSRKIDQKQSESKLTQEGTEWKEAERIAALERSQRRALEDRQEKESEINETKVDFEQKNVPPANQGDAFSGLYGRVGVTWTHEGVAYDALVTTNGPRGIAVVNFRESLTGTQVSVEQDLELLKNANGTFYVGSNPRFAGTNLATSLYRPDIFKLTPLRDGNWTIGEIGDSWDHFDKAFAR